MPRKSSQRQIDFDAPPSAESQIATPVAPTTITPPSVPAEEVVKESSKKLAAAKPLAEKVQAIASEGCKLPQDLAGLVVYAIDSHSLIFQVFHAFHRQEMTSPKGEPVGAVYGFARDILYLLESKKPDFLFCAFDRSEPTFRHELYDQYKADRSEMPEELRPQVGAIRRFLEALKIPVLDFPTYEADDVLATLARLVEERGGECYVVTGDKDCRQLITERVKVYNIRKDEIYDAVALQAEWGVRPDQVIDFQALVGDAVDNVPGVPLIGPKMAGELLAKFNTLEDLLARVEELPAGKRKENLKSHGAIARLSRQLVRLETHVPMEIELEKGRVGGIDVDSALGMFQEFGFRSLSERLAAFKGKDAPATWKQDYRTVATTEDLQNFVEELSKQSFFSFDTETTSIRPREAKLVGCSFAWKPGEAYYIPLRAPAGEPQISPDIALPILRPILEDPAIRKVGQNLKYDMVVLRGAGIEMQGLSFDTMVASYLLEAGERTHNLDDLARKYLNHRNIPIEQLIGTGKNQRRMDEVPVKEITDYAAEDADVALRLWPILEPRLVEDELIPLFADLEVPLIEVLVEMEFNGIRVDVPRLKVLSEEFGKRMTELEREIYAIAGKEFNIASPKQLAEILFNELKLPVLKKTKTGPSTDAEVLEELAAQHPLPAKIVEYRQYAKLQGTYVDALPQLVFGETGRVHTSFNQTVAATGRLSSNDPNLQNIPIRTDAGREIRSAFLPGDEGWSLLAADYSQIELRVLAHFSGDDTLCQAFARDEDIHSRVASEVYAVALADVSSAQRRTAKVINFGVVYGQSPFGLAKVLGIDQEEATAYITKYFASYPGVDDFFRQLLVDCRKMGYVKTILGRRRAIQGVRDPLEASRMSDPTRQRILPERTAINTVIQGSAADLIKLAMIGVQKRLRAEKWRSRLLLQIHDELILESPSEELAALEGMIREEMSRVMELAVPLKVDVKVGKNWAECE